MGSSSDRSVYNGETTHRNSHTVAKKTKSSSSKTSMSRRAVQSYMSTKNEGGDSVTARSLRPDSSGKSNADRQAKVERNVAAALAMLNKTSS